MMDKKACRECFLAIRQKITVAERHVAAARAMHWLTESDLYLNSNNIAAYIKITTEFDCTPCIQSIWQMGKACYLPSLGSKNPKELIFLSFHEGDALLPNRYGIPEPLGQEKIAVAALDVVLMPLLAFDREGRRLGMGGGYYDYTFAYLRTLKKRPCRLIGVAFSQQQAECLPEDPWDVRLDGVLTEKGLMLW